MNRSEDGEQISIVNEYDELDFKVLATILWQSKLLVVGITSLFVMGAVIYALTATQWYRAQVLVANASSSPPAGLAGQLAGLGGLASLAGINLGSGNASEPLAVLKSQDVARSFIEEQQLLPLFFDKRWDATKKSWRGEQDDWPDIRDGVRYFDKKVRVVQEDRKSSMVTLTIEWKDPVVAAQWANQLIERVNAIMRARAQSEAQANIDYLRKELVQTDAVTLQLSIGRLLESEMQKLMMARGKEEFAFRIIDKAQPPKWRSRPKRAQLVIMGGLLGGLCSILFVVGRALVRRGSTEPA